MLDLIDSQITYRSRYLTGVALGAGARHGAARSLQSALGRISNRDRSASTSADAADAAQRRHAGRAAADDCNGWRPKSPRRRRRISTRRSSWRSSRRSRISREAVAATLFPAPSGDRRSATARAALRDLQNPASDRLFLRGARRVRDACLARHAARRERRSARIAHELDISPAPASVTFRARFLRQCRQCRDDRQSAHRTYASKPSREVEVSYARRHRGPADLAWENVADAALARARSVCRRRRRIFCLPARASSCRPT